MSLADPDDRPCVVHCFRAASVSDFARDAWAMQKGHLMAVALETIILCRLSRSYIIYHVYSQYIGVSLNRSPPKSPMLFQFNRIFHYKSSILVYLHFMETSILYSRHCLLPFFVVGCMTPQKKINAALVCHHMFAWSSPYDALRPWILDKWGIGQDLLLPYFGE